MEKEVKEIEDNSQVTSKNNKRQNAIEEDNKSDKEK